MYVNGRLQSSEDYASETRKCHNTTQPMEKQNGRTEFLEKFFAVPILLIYCQMLSAGSFFFGGGGVGRRSLRQIYCENTYFSPVLPTEVPKWHFLV